jgi:hypothetical protein
MEQETNVARASMTQENKQNEIKRPDEMGTAHYWRWRFVTGSHEMFVTVVREDGSESPPQCILSNHRLTEGEMAQAYSECVQLAGSPA